MPKVKRSRKPPPDGWELIEPTLDELDQKMREGEADDLSESNTTRGASKKEWFVLSLMENNHLRITIRAVNSGLMSTGRDDEVKRGPD